MNNPLTRIDYEQLRKMLGKADATATQSTLNDRTVTANVYAEAPRSLAMSVVRFTAMRKIIDSNEWNFFPFGNVWQQCASGEDVIEKVKANRAGIGFVLFKDRLPTGVKVLSVSKRPDDPAIKPSDAPLIQTDYPLAQPLVLYLHPTQPVAAKRFCEFAVSPEGAAIAEQFSLITPWRENQYYGEKRVAEMKAGKGPRIFVPGVTGGRAVLQDVAVDFVRAKALLQVTYQPGESAAAVGGFVNAGSPQRELLLLDGRPNEQTLRQYGTKWNDLQPVESMPAAAAVAVVVNPANKIASLSIDQLQSILTGKTGDWKLLGSTARSGDIHVFGLPGDTTTSKIISKELLPITQASKLKTRKDIAEVLSAVSLDPQAIGFVDLAAIPAGQNVKILPIGPAIKPADPTPANIKSGMYPLAQRMFLYVHPKASDTAKDFAKFLTSGECDETFRKNGLIPLSDQAIAGIVLPSKSTTQPATQPAALIDKSRPPK
ncbi:MAG: substrate-binding domain-containing protein [Phycisphaerales bacterium]|nr:substrate-binding domain-containing protein [Phycisphaerales bacterium]